MMIWMFWGLGGLRIWLGGDEKNLEGFEEVRRFVIFRDKIILFTPPPGIEPGCQKGSVFETDAIPLCDGGLEYLEKEGF